MVGADVPRRARTIWHALLAVSLDGKIARTDGSVDWLADFPAEDFGFEAFLSGVDAIVMGRASYDKARRLGEWAYAGKPTVVLTGRPIVDAPPGVEAKSGDLAALATEIDGRGYGRVWVFGGGRTIAGLMAANRLDVLELGLIPLVLGAGIPLFPPETPPAAFALDCSEAAGSQGGVRLIYRRRP